tara:strand:+ start:354 stop:602 length:249 start_codon:yes stop_codon:yes gene_type:complete
MGIIMITNQAKNLMRSFSRIPDITSKKEESGRGLLSPVKTPMNNKENITQETKPLVDAVKAYQQIRKARFEIIDARKQNGNI